MRPGSASLACSLTLLLLGSAACKPEPEPSGREQPSPAAQPQPQPAAAPGPASDLDERRASAAVAEAMLAVRLLDAQLEPGAGVHIDASALRSAWEGPLAEWVATTDAALGRGDAKLSAASLARIEDLDDPDARRTELLVLVTQLRAAALFETRRLLTEASDPDPGQVPAAIRQRQWDDAGAIWDAALRPLAARADALERRGGEDWEQTILDAFVDGRAALDDPTIPKASRQIIEKGTYAVAYRLILANAEGRDPAEVREAAGLLELLDDRLADRNGPGLKRMRRALHGDPNQIDPAMIERELAVAFSKRARKYCDKAVVKAELGSPAAIAETWEGVVYTKVILPSMREAIASEGFDADAYMADWLAYLDAVEAADADTAAAISGRLVEWNCAYQDRLGIAACTASADEPG
jgi:hypothetical protein